MFDFYEHYDFVDEFDERFCVKLGNVNVLADDNADAMVGVDFASFDIAGKGTIEQYCPDRMVTAPSHLARHI